MKLQLLASLVLVSDIHAAVINEPAPAIAPRGEQGRARHFFDLFPWRQSACKEPDNFQGEIEVNGERKQYRDFGDFQRAWNENGQGGLRQWLPWLFPSSCTTAVPSPTAPEIVDGKNNAASTHQPFSSDIAVPSTTPIEGGNGTPTPNGSSALSAVPEITSSSDDSNGANAPDSISASSNLPPTFSTSSSSSEPSLLVASSVGSLVSSSADVLASSTAEPSLISPSSAELPISSSAGSPAPSGSGVNPVPTSEPGQSGSEISVASSSGVLPTSSELSPSSNVAPTSVPNVSSSSDTLNGTIALPTSTDALPNTTGVTSAPPNATVIPTQVTINGSVVPTNVTAIPTVTTINGTVVPTLVPINSTQLPTNTTPVVPEPTIRMNSGSIDNPSVVEGIDKVRGVNLGGWLVYEGWITADGGGFGSGKGWVDEWTMAQSYDQNRDYINAHWQGWVTEDDFAEIAAAGLNTVRIPVGYWTFIPTEGDEPYRGLNVTWETLKRAFEWALKYGLRIMLDMHAVPGPQSLDAHSGHKTDHAGFFFSDRNKNRTIEALVVAAREFTQPKYGNVLKSLMLVNEPRLPDERKEEARAWLKQFYVDAHAAVRSLPEPRVQNVTILIHDSFDGADRYGDFKNATGDPNVAMDRHLYAIFEPTKANWTGDAVLRAQCQAANELVNFAKRYYTVMVAEFGAPARGGSCSWFTGVEGVENPGQCPPPGDSHDTILWVKDSLLAQIEAYERTAGWVFWTWKTANGDLGWDMRRIIEKVLKGTLGVDRFDQIALNRCEYYNASMPALP